MRIAIIDADSLVWVTAYHNRDKERFNPTVLAQSIRDIFHETGATHFLGFLGTPGDHTFRNEIYPEYKGHRPDKPEFMEKWEQSIRDYLINTWKFQEVKGIEADDAVSICHRAEWISGLNKTPYIQGEVDTQELKESAPTTLCSPDKDLKQVPGDFYDFNKKIGGHITVEEAEKYLWTQVLTGDASDGIKGLPGIGPKKAQAIFDNGHQVFLCQECGKDEIEVNSPMYIQVLQQYCWHYKSITKGIEEFYKNYTLVKMLESHPDFVIPTPNKV